MAPSAGTPPAHLLCHEPVPGPLAYFRDPRGPWRAGGGVVGVTVSVHRRQPQPLVGRGRQGRGRQHLGHLPPGPEVFLEARTGGRLCGLPPPTSRPSGRPWPQRPRACGPPLAAVLLRRGNSAVGPRPTDRCTPPPRPLRQRGSGSVLAGQPITPTGRACAAVELELQHARADRAVRRRTATT